MPRLNTVSLAALLASAAIHVVTFNHLHRWHEEADASAQRESSLRRTVARLKAEARASKERADGTGAKACEPEPAAVERAPRPKGRDAAALAACEADKARLEERLREPRRGALAELPETPRAMGQCAGTLLAERATWHARVQGVMGAALRAYAECPGAAKLLPQAEPELLARERAAAAADRIKPERGAASRQLRRGLLGAAAEAVADGADPVRTDAIAAGLLARPELSSSTVEREKQALEWMDAVRKAAPRIADGLEVRMMTPEKRAKVISRTVDAEKVFPHLFVGLPKVDTVHWEDKWEHFRATRLKRQGKRFVGYKTGGTGAYYATAAQRVVAEWGEEHIYAPPQYGSCALVGNSQRQLLTKAGAEIDKHDTVFRINNAPTLGYEEYVGKRTTHRIINNQWSGEYGQPFKRAARLPLEWNVTLLVSRTDHEQYYETVTNIKQNRADVALVRLLPDTAHMAADLLQQLRLRIEKARGLEYVGKGSPSTGFVGTFLLMQLCEKVTVYGVGLGGCQGTASGGCVGGSSWHYWEEDIKELAEKSREFGEEPHHSFELEHDAMQLLGAAGFISLGEAAHANKAGMLASQAQELRNVMPSVVAKAQRKAMHDKMSADIRCAATTGSLCGCPRQCTSPNEFDKETVKTRVKEAVKKVGER